MGLDSFYEYLEHFGNYDPSDKSSKGRKIYFKNILERVEKYLGSRVLDLACGGGIVSLILSDMNKRVVGVDIQDEMLEIARRHVHGKDNLLFVKGDITKLDLKESFDSALFLGNSIVHFDLYGFENILESVKKHVRGGYFIVEYSDFIWRAVKEGRFSPSNSISGKRIMVNYNQEEGCISLLVITNKIREDLFEAEQHCYYLWSPWIVEFVSNKNDFALVERFYTSENTYVDVYKTP